MSGEADARKRRGTQSRMAESLDPTRTPVIVDALRTPIGRFRGVLSPIRPDDLAGHVIQALKERHPAALEDLEDVYFGAANQAGEDNRNVARMGALLAGLPVEVPGVTLNRLCGSGMEAVIQAAKSIMVGEGAVYIAGGVESMTRAPYVMPKGDTAFHTKPEVYDTALGWRMINPQDGRAVPDRDARRDRRERRDPTRDQPRRSGRVGAAQPSARRRRPGRRPVRRRDHLDHRPPRSQEGPAARDPRRVHPPRHLARAARQAADRVPQGRERDRGQLVAAQRRRRGLADHSRRPGPRRSGSSRWPRSSRGATPACTRT